MPSHDKWNPWHGCTKCSEGCKNCYMYELDRLRKVKVPSTTVHKTGTFDYPLSKTRSGKYKVLPGERLMVNMTSDTFIEEADEWRDDMWAIIKERSDVIFWLLTKRPQRIEECLPEDWGDGYENVMLNITCENQNQFAIRIRYLLNAPAKHKGLCLAPLLGPIDLTFALKSGQIEEVSVGGENYSNPRPCNYDWVKAIALQCQQYKVNFCFYETGTRFIFHGNEFLIPSKGMQSRLAFVSCLNQKYYNIDYKLVDKKGDDIALDKRYHPRFNRNHCFLCSNQMVCNGCSGCGHCGTEVDYYSRDEMEQEQNDYMRLIDTKGVKNGG